MGRQLGGFAPLGRGSWVPIQNSVARAEAYLHAKLHLDPSNRLATVHQRHRQTGQTGQYRQRYDSIGRTVLQTVAQKPSLDAADYKPVSNLTIESKSAVEKIVVERLTRLSRGSMLKPNYFNEFLVLF